LKVSCLLRGVFQVGTLLFRYHVGTAWTSAETCAGADVKPSPGPSLLEPRRTLNMAPSAQEGQIGAVRVLVEQGHHQKRLPTPPGRSWFPIPQRSGPQRLLESPSILPTPPGRSWFPSISSLGFLPTPPRGNYRCTPIKVQLDLP
jgi:hypothetical protein